MTREKKRYKAVIANHTYTIIGHESKKHMDLVTKLLNEQLAEIMGLSPQIDTEQAATLLAVNALSDQLKKQEQLLKLQNVQEEARRQAIKIAELENRLKRIDAIEAEAKAILQKNGQGDHQIQNHVEAQQILNENRKQEIQKRVASK